MAASGFADRWDWFYRSQRYWRARSHPAPHGVTRRLLMDSWGNRSAGLFHGLNQRLPGKRFRRQIATFHDLFVFSGEYSTPEFRERFAFQAREASAGADAIIAVSRFTAAQVETLLGYPPSQIRVVHHGVSPRQIPNVAREKVVLCVGAIQRRKNQAALVRAFAALPSDWMLVLAGSQGFAAAETLSEIERSPARERIRITGYLSDAELSVWYARARIFAFPSFDEGFGMPVLEAMSAGIPVITSNRSALPEVAGDAAILIDPDQDEELASALRTLAADENVRQRFIALGRTRVSAFSWQKAIEKTLAVYRNLIS